MSLFKNADERLIERFEKEEAEMLLKFYGLRKTDSNCPRNANLLYPERLHLTSYEILPQNVVKLNIGYKTRWSGYVTDTVRINYDRTVLGTIYCEEVESYLETTYNRKGTIKIPFLSKTKILNLPVGSSHNIEIKCNKLKVDSINIYAENDGELIPDEEYREQIAEQLKNR